MSEPQTDRVVPAGALWAEPKGFHSDITLTDGECYREPLLKLDGSIAKTTAEAEAAMGRLCKRLDEDRRLDRGSGVARFYLGNPGSIVVPLRSTPIDEAPEIPVPVSDGVSSWRRIIHNTSRDDARVALSQAARDLFRLLLVVKTNDPKAHPIARIYAIDALKEFAEFHEIDVDDAQLIVIEAQAAAAKPEPSAGDKAISTSSRAAAPLCPLHLVKFLELEVPPRRLMLSPWLSEKGSAMVYALKGVGKTHLGLRVGHAVAAGGSFLGWSAAEPRRVLYIDGEMPAADMQKRLKAIAAGLGGDASTNFRMLCGDLTERGLPDLATREGQRAFDDAVGDADLIILDNISTLCRSGKENEAEAWQTVQDWTLAHRREGRSIIFLHHAGRGGQQRGTSKREDILDSMIELRHPPDYAPGQGARFEVHFEKHRGFHGLDAEPFEARYEERDNAAMWSRTAIVDADLTRVVDALGEEGMSIRDAAKDLEMSKGRVERLKRKAVERGLLKG